MKASESIELRAFFKEEALEEQNERKNFFEAKTRTHTNSWGTGGPTEKEAKIRDGKVLLILYICFF